MSVLPENFKTLLEWLNWQESLHITEIDLGLDRVQQVAVEMALLQPSATIITVAGTNGKGSCIAALEALLLRSGASVGAFTSPHLHVYNERIRIDGQNVTDQDLCHSFSRINRARKKTSLTYFEFGTLAAIDLFTLKHVDVMLLEVGLGGRLDAVNIMPHDVSVVTSIALDHEAWLGSDVNNIGREKAGIFRSQKPALCADTNAPASVGLVAQECGAEFISVPSDFSWLLDESTWSWSGRNKDGCFFQIDELPLPKLPLPSVAAAIMAFLYADIDVLKNENKIQFLFDYLPSILSELSLPGRTQIMTVANRSLIFDVAHNPAAAVNLSSYLKRNRIAGETWAIVGMMSDKDHLSVFKSLADSVNHWLTTDLHDVTRAASAIELKNQLLASVGPDLSVKYFDHVSKALSLALTNSQAEDRIIIFGSFFTVAQAQSVLDAVESNLIIAKER